MQKVDQVLIHCRCLHESSLSLADFCLLATNHIPPIKCDQRHSCFDFVPTRAYTHLQVEKNYPLYLYTNVYKLKVNVGYPKSGKRSNLMEPFKLTTACGANYAVQGAMRYDTETKSRKVVIEKKKHSMKLKYIRSHLKN